MRIDKVTYPHLAQHMDELLRRLDDQRERIVTLTAERDGSYRKGYRAGYEAGRRKADTSMAGLVGA